MKHRHLCVSSLVALASLGIAESTTEAQPCVAITQNVNCATMPFLAPNQTWVPPLNELDWQPNRLPIAFINLRSGNYCSGTGGNPRGSVSWWYVHDDDSTYTGDTSEADAAFDALENRLTSAYNAGYRRVILALPAGTARGNLQFGSSQYWGMPAWKRDRILCVINAWRISKPEMQIEIYGNFQNVGDRASLCSQQSNGFSAPQLVIEPQSCSGGGNWYYPCLGATTAYPPSPFDQNYVCVFHDTIRAWRQAGVGRYWLDYSTADWDKFIELAHCPLYWDASASNQKHFLGAEAFPIVLIGDDEYDIDLATRGFFAPSIAFPNFFIEFDEDKLWDVSPEASLTELVALVDHTTPPP